MYIITVKFTELKYTVMNFELTYTVLIMAFFKYNNNLLKTNSDNNVYD